MIDKYKPSNIGVALRQGEILTNVKQYNISYSENETEKESEKLIFSSITHPYVIVVTKDCDLDWDYKARFKPKGYPSVPTSKLLNSIILCEIDTAQNIRTSEGNDINSKEWNLVKTHRHERYYFFEEIDSKLDFSKSGLPELTADFKKVFSLDSDFLYEQVDREVLKRRVVLNDPYLQHFAQRYSNFHGRVALPHDYQSL